MCLKRIVIKIESIDEDTFARFFHILKDFVVKNIDGHLIREIGMVEEDL